jgi:hypothetical protein
MEPQLMWGADPYPCSDCGVLLHGGVDWFVRPRDGAFLHVECAKRRRALIAEIAARAEERYGGVLDALADL